MARVLGEAGRYVTEQERKKELQTVLVALKQLFPLTWRGMSPGVSRQHSRTAAGCPYPGSPLTQQFFYRNAEQSSEFDKHAPTREFSGPFPEGKSALRHTDPLGQPFTTSVTRE
jgi:hypothetical protein